MRGGAFAELGCGIVNFGLVIAVAHLLAVPPVVGESQPTTAASPAPRRIHPSAQRGGLIADRNWPTPRRRSAPDVRGRLVDVRAVRAIQSGVRPVEKRSCAITWAQVDDYHAERSKTKPPRGPALRKRRGQVHCDLDARAPHLGFAHPQPRVRGLDPAVDEGDFPERRKHGQPTRHGRGLRQRYGRQRR